MIINIKKNGLTMPKLSLWNRRKGYNYKYVDHIVKQVYNMAGVGVFLHKYLGPSIVNKKTENFPNFTEDSTINEISSQENQRNKNVDFENNLNEFKIQDLFYLENRDRKYSEDIIELRAHYSITDTEFDLRAFGLFINTDELIITFHYNEMIERVGREIIPGDVLEILNLEDMVLDKNKPLINKFYVVMDGTKASEGYDPFWWHHIWKTRCDPVRNQQEFYDLLRKEMRNQYYEKTGKTLEEIMSEYKNDLIISDEILNEARKHVDKRKFKHYHLYIIPKRDQYGNIIEDSMCDEKICIAYGDGIPPNGAKLVGSGISFPENSQTGDYFLRIDYSPHVLFKRVENGWVRKEVDWRSRWSAANDILRRFINQDEYTEYQNTNTKIKKKQYLSKVIKPNM
jgi:hypothetical protein